MRGDIALGTHMTRLGRVHDKDVRATEETMEEKKKKKEPRNLGHHIHTLPTNSVSAAWCHALHAESLFSVIPKPSITCIIPKPVMHFLYNSDPSHEHIST